MAQFINAALKSTEPGVVTSGGERTGDCGDAGGPGVVRDAVSQFRELVKWHVLGSRKYQDHVLWEALKEELPKKWVVEILTMIAQ